MQMATAEHVRQVFERYTKALTARDFDLALSLFAPDATARDPVDGPPLQNLDALRAVLTGASDAIRAVRLTGPVRVSADCRHAAAPIEADVDFGDGPRVMSVVDVLTFDDDGRITSLTAYYGPTNLRDG
jgi:steroid Delta-isomerase